MVFRIFIVVFGVLWKLLSPKIRRWRLLRDHFPDEWKEILGRNVAVYHKLPADLRTQLHQKINVFLGEKVFKGCGGLAITDEIKVTIAAQACLLLLNRPAKFFPGCLSILVYPSAYVAKETTRSGYFVNTQTVARLGESWQNGPVVLAWDGVKSGAGDPADGENLVLHEFAHKLDQEDGCADGYPRLDTRSHYRAWARHLGEAFQEMQKKAGAGQRIFLREYALTNPAEFFSAATEVFLERPAALKEKFPDVYGELKDFYRLDPAAWG